MEPWTWAILGGNPEQVQKRETIFVTWATLAEASATQSGLERQGPAANKKSGTSSVCPKHRQFPPFPE